MEARRYESHGAVPASTCPIESIGDRQWVARERMMLAVVLVRRGRPAEALAPMSEVCGRMHALGYRLQRGDLSHRACPRRDNSGSLGAGARARSSSHLGSRQDLRERCEGRAPEAAFSAHASMSGTSCWQEFSLSLHAREPGKGWDAAALEVERDGTCPVAARGDHRRPGERSLRECLRRSWRAGKDLDRRTDGRSPRAGQVLGRGIPPDEADGVERKLEACRKSRERLENADADEQCCLRRARPAKPLSLDEIRANVLDD